MTGPALLLLWGFLAAPACPALIVKPGPVELSPVAAAPAPSSVEAWQTQFQAFLRADAPDPAAVFAAARALAEFDPGKPDAKAALAPLARTLAAELPAILAAPDSASASQAQLEASSLKLKVLNFPAVRALLPEADRERIGAAAWAYNDHLWDRKDRDAGQLASGIAERLAAARTARRNEPAPSPSGPDLTLEVVSGDFTAIPVDAAVATIDEAGTCQGGVHSAIEARGGSCYRQALEKAGPLREGESFLAKGPGAPGGFKHVLYLSDRRERPLKEVVRDALLAADRAGLTSVALPALRTGSVFGALEGTYAELAAGLKRGVELFMALPRAALSKVSLVARNDSELARTIQGAFAGPRERSLREDLRPTELSGRGFSLTARPAEVADRSSPIYASLLKPWSLEHLTTPHSPVKIGEIEDKSAFTGPTPSVLNMPIKLPGQTEFKLPEELVQFREFLQKIIDHEAAVNPEMKDFYAYLTVDQHEVEAGKTHRRPGVHIDGVQGARYKVKLPPEHLYSASDKLGTVFYHQPFDLRRLDPARQHVHAELERQASEENARAVPGFEIAFWDSYSVHRADVAREPMRRTFIRVEFSKKKYDSEGDTVNPALDYHWERVARPIPADLDDRPLERAAESVGFPDELAEIESWAPHTVKKLGKFLEDNLGEETVRAARRRDAPFLISVGEGKKALARARALGWTVGEKVPKREGFHQVFRARDPSGRPGYLIQRVNGDDRVLHVQSLLKLAGAPPGDVRTTGATESLRARFKRAFDAQGYVPDLVVYGFANTAIDAALLRNAFRNGRHFITLRRNYARKKAAIAGASEGEADDLDGMSMQVLTLADGRRIWFLHCMFGDLARDLVGAAMDHGAKDVAFIGSAGDLGRDARMRELIVPARRRLPNGDEEELNLPSIPGIPRRGVYLRVPTPNVGTLAWVEKTRASGVDVIESELGHLLDEMELHPDVRFQVALVIAEARFGPDGRDMTEWGLLDLRALLPGLGKVLDAALGATTKDYIVKKFETIPLNGR